MMTRLAESPILDAQKKKHAQVRAVCCWSLDVALSIFNLIARVKMATQAVCETTWLCRLHAVCYQWLACECLAQRRLLYKIRPKTHYFLHMIDHQELTKL